MVSPLSAIHQKTAETQLVIWKVALCIILTCELACLRETQPPLTDGVTQIALAEGSEAGAASAARPSRDHIWKMRRHSCLKPHSHKSQGLSSAKHGQSLLEHYFPGVLERLFSLN